MPRRVFGFKIPELMWGLTATVTCWFCCCCSRIPRLPLPSRELVGRSRPTWALKWNMAVSCVRISQHPVAYLPFVNSSPAPMPLSLSLLHTYSFPLVRPHTTMIISFVLISYCHHLLICLSPPLDCELHREWGCAWIVPVSPCAMQLLAQRMDSNNVGWKNAFRPEELDSDIRKIFREIFLFLLP